jgi:TP901 family phage tail tape measure protein
MAFIIPTIFTAKENMGPVVSRMQGMLGGLNTTAERTGKSLGSIFGNVAKYAVASAATAGVGAALLFSAKALADYEKELARLRALTGVTGKDFLGFKKIIEDTARETKRSTVVVAQSFTTIANAMPELLKDAEGLGLVTKASILLAKAASMELEPAAESVTTILNQFGKGARDASKLVDMLAAGSKYGSAEIEDLAASMREFGAQANIAGVSMQESIGLTEIVSKFRKGTQAGIELRNVLLYINTIKQQDPRALKDMIRLGVNMDLVSNKSLPLVTRLTELKKIMNDNAALYHLFNRENVAMAATVLKNTDALGPMIEKIGESGVAQQMAYENTRTLYAALTELKAAWINITTASRGGNAAMTAVGNTVRFLADNLGTILNIVLPLTGAWLAYKTVMWSVRSATWLYNVATGLAAGFTSNLSIALMENTVAAKAETIAIRLRTVAMWATASAANAVLAATGIGIAALIAYGFYSSLTSDNVETLNNDLDQAGNKFKDIKKPINEATIAMRDYNRAVDEYNKQQDTKAVHDYNMKRHPVKTVLTDLFTDNPFRPAGGEQLKQPEIKDYFPNPADTAKIQTPDDAGTKQYHIDKNGNLEIIIKNESGNQLGITNNSGIPVKLNNTGSYK